MIKKLALFTIVAINVVHTSTYAAWSTDDVIQGLQVAQGVLSLPLAVKESVDEFNRMIDTIKCIERKGFPCAPTNCKDQQACVAAAANQVAKALGMVVYPLMGKKTETGFQPGVAYYLFKLGDVRIKQLENKKRASTKDPKIKWSSTDEDDLTKWKKRVEEGREKFQRLTLEMISSFELINLVSIMLNPPTTPGELPKLPEIKIVEEKSPFDVEGI